MNGFVIAVGAAGIVLGLSLPGIIGQDVAVTDECYSLGYQSCIVKDGVLLPSTSDPKIRRELNRFVRQLQTEYRRTKR